MNNALTQLPLYSVHRETDRLCHTLGESENKVAAEVATIHARDIERVLKQAAKLALLEVEQLDNDVSDHPRAAISQHRLGELDTQGKLALTQWAVDMRQLLSSITDLVEGGY
jgi:hypothetical protein